MTSVERKMLIFRSDWKFWGDLQEPRLDKGVKETHDARSARNYGFAGYQGAPKLYYDKGLSKTLPQGYSKDKRMAD